MILVVDASVTIAWIVEDEQSAYAQAALDACQADRAFVPFLWRWEIANTLLVLERKGRLTDAAATYSSVIRNLPIEAVNDSSESLGLEEIKIARQHDLSIYDSAYLALAKSRGVALATLDKKLAKAAKKEGVFYS